MPLPLSPIHSLTATGFDSNPKRMPDNLKSGMPKSVSRQIAFKNGLQDKAGFLIGTVPPAHRTGLRERLWWAHQDLNLEPTDYESAALTN
jgi:hypothetical protein